MKGSNTTCLQHLKEFVTKKAAAMAVTHHKVLEWSAVHHSDIPGQSNQFDCGVFICMYARMLAEEVPFNFSQKDIRTCNKKTYCIRAFDQKIVVR